MDRSILRIIINLLQIIASLAFCCSTSISAQVVNQYNARFNLATIDTVAQVACYDIEISNAGSTAWVIGAYNLSILYDASAACFASDTLISDDIVYSYSVQHQVTSTTGTGLPYEDSIGFLRVNLAPEDQPASLDSLRDLVDTIGTQIPTIRLCFDLKFTDITSPETCFQMDFSTPALEAQLMLPANTMQEWAGAFILINVTPGTLNNVRPDRSRTGCFVIEENTPDLCSDGIDNDEDGLTDCMDIDGCSPGILAIRISPPTCFDTLGGFVVGGGRGTGLTFSADNGRTFQEDSTFTEFSPGAYSIVVRRNGINILGCVFETPVIIRAPACDEISNSNCTNGLDDDGDGLLDCDDPDCRPFLNEVIVMAPDNCPTLDNGTIAIVTTYPDASFSIDNGVTFASNGTFTNLPEGNYTVVIRNEITLCIADTMPMISLTANPPCPAPQELCRDNVDNDNDGLIDCQDPDCQGDPICEPTITYYIPNVMDRLSAVNSRFVIHTPTESPLGIDELNIFDRYGNVMFNRSATSTTDPGHTWDGRINNRDVAAGVYVYQVTLNQDGVQYQISGDITILQ